MLVQISRFVGMFRLFYCARLVYYVNERDSHTVSIIIPQTLKIAASVKVYAAHIDRNPVANLEINAYEEIQSIG
jgi:aspartyl aminopeptidase